MPKHTSLRALLFAVLAVLLAAAALSERTPALPVLPALSAQSVRWEPASGTLAAGRPARLSLVFEDCAPDTDPVLPAVAGASFAGPQVSMMSSSINGSASTRRTYIYAVTVSAKPGETLRIPAVEFATDKGKVGAPAAEFRVAAGSAAAGSNNAAAGASDITAYARAAVEAPSRTVWAGEVFTLAHTLTLDERLRVRELAAPRWDEPPAPAVEEWRGKPSRTSEFINGNPAALLRRETRVCAPATPAAGAGTAASAQFEVTLPGSTQELHVLTQRRPDPLDPFGGLGGSFFNQSFTRVEIPAAPAKFTVKPLPVPAPAGFAGAVGEFKLEQKVVPRRAAVGDPVTWTLKLAGTGNWPAIAALPPREVSRDFRAISPRAEKTLRDGKLFEGALTEDIVLIPGKAGRYTLGPVSMSVFNPARGEYETLTAPAVTIEISPAAAGAATGGAAGGENSGSGEGAGSGRSTGANAATGNATALPPLAAPPPPAQPIPLDALNTAAGDAAPAGTGGLLAAGAFPAPLVRRPWLLLALPALLWPALAYIRARRDDPARPRREARKRLVQTLAKIAATTGGTGTAGTGSSSAGKGSSRAAGVHAGTAVHPLLLAWQRDTAVLLGMDTLAPDPRRLGDEEHEALWREADRTLYKRDHALSAKWLPAARRVLAQTPAPRVWFWRALSPRNLLPNLRRFQRPAATGAAGTAVAAAQSSRSGGVHAATTAAIAALLLALAPNAAAAAAGTGTDAALAAYSRADFAAAETAWRKLPRTAAGDYNLSLALAQQERWDEAAARAAAAFLAAPRDARLRWQLRLALGKAGFTPEPLAPFLAAITPDTTGATTGGDASATGTGTTGGATTSATADTAGVVAPLVSWWTRQTHCAAALLAAPAWENLRLLAAAAIALALVLLLLALYRALPPRAAKRAAAALLATGAAAGAAAQLALACYGPVLRNPRAALVWRETKLFSVPTEADAAQQTATLPAGTVILRDAKTFLGWRRVELPAGQTGWLRDDSALSLRHGSADFQVGTAQMRR
ncbi:MAG: BatD family protein [Puniceicoccales bacterium]|nr:BatD family protein [Puniceicoccales bacterium]